VSRDLCVEICKIVGRGDELLGGDFFRGHGGIIRICNLTPGMVLYRLCPCFCCDLGPVGITFIICMSFFLRFSFFLFFQ